MLKAGIASLALIAAAAMAEPPADATSEAVKAQAASYDPNQVVCVVESDTRSRLAQRRVCRTRAGWDNHRAQQRRFTERMQMPAPD